MARSDPGPDLIIRIHGTGASQPGDDGPGWWQCGSPFHGALEARLHGRATCFPRCFHWSGKNSEQERRAAGRELFEEWLLPLERHGQPYHLVGHSHGGSVIWHALGEAQQRKLNLDHLRSWTTIATPFLQFRPDPKDKALGIIGLLVGVILMALEYLALGAYYESRGGTSPDYPALVVSLLALPALGVPAAYCGKRAFESVRAHLADRSERKRAAAAFEGYRGRWLGVFSRHDEAIHGLRGSQALRGEITFRIDNLTGPLIKHALSELSGNGAADPPSAAPDASERAQAGVGTNRSLRPVWYVLALLFAFSLMVLFWMFTAEVFERLQSTIPDRPWQSAALRLMLPTLGTLSLSGFVTLGLLRILVRPQTRRRDAGPSASAHVPAGRVEAERECAELADRVSPTAWKGRTAVQRMAAQPSPDLARTTAMLLFWPLQYLLTPSLLFLIFWSNLEGTQAYFQNLVIYCLMAATMLPALLLPPAAEALRFLARKRLQRQRMARRAGEDPHDPMSWIDADASKRAIGMLDLAGSSLFGILIRESYGNLHNALVAPAIDEVIWTLIRRRAQGSDLSGNILEAVTETPVPHVMAPPLDDAIDAPILEGADRVAARAIGRLRTRIGPLTVAATSIWHVVEAIQREEIFTWREMVHNSYFDSEPIQDLVAEAVLGRRTALEPVPPSDAGRAAGNLRYAVNSLISLVLVVLVIEFLFFFVVLVLSGILVFIR